MTFFDGVPSADPGDYDMLDLNRAIEVYLNTLPGASLVAMPTVSAASASTATRHWASSRLARTPAPSS
ncbi:hypothetical protein [Actinomycetospora sp. NBC_00405]|uniref:hypothetical protein n=1 Tax=Actinomycetospora sp. NBC_00405 TaxID=2975952 RepID=UPI002E2483D3